jgi:hypothetical protein
VLRLYSLGFLDNVYLGMRPWTHASLSHLLENTSDAIADAEQGPATEEAREIYEALDRELRLDADAFCMEHVSARVDSTYTVARAISGMPLRDSFHLGSTIVNDYGRPYENGFKQSHRCQRYAIAGRFTLYLRGEFQGAQSATGYPPALYQTLAAVDETINPVTGLAYPNQITIPEGPIATATQGRFLEASSPHKCSIM